MGINWSATNHTLVTVLSLTWEPPYLGKTVFILRRSLLAPWTLLEQSVLYSDKPDFCIHIRDDWQGTNYLD